jgi:hypothetical protein
LQLKKKVCFLLAMALLLLIVSGCTRETTTGLEYSYENAGIGSGRYYAVSGDGMSGKIVIPKLHDGASVTMVNHWGFDRNEYLIQVVMQKGLCVIGRYAFYNCRRLKKVTIPDSVTQIGGHAFALCYKLTAITYEGTVEQWEQMQRESTWLEGTENVQNIICKDGTVPV